MSKRTRIVSFGGAGLLVLGGALAAAVSGGAGQIAAMSLIGIGLVTAVSLAFYEVGLSEDAERARERDLSAADVPPSDRPRASGARVKPRLERSRGRRRRLHRDAR